MYPKFEIKNILSTRFNYIKYDFIFIFFVINFYGFKKSLAHFNLHPIYKHWCIDYELDKNFNAFSLPYFSCKFSMTTSHSFSHAFN
jgi:hypothetical protein